jgi:hypothetical protein
MLVHKAPPCKSSALDPLPTWLLKDCLPAFAAMLTDVINLSLSSGQVSRTLKEAIVSPLLKKPVLDAEQLKN